MGAKRCICQSKNPPPNINEKSAMAMKSQAKSIEAGRFFGSSIPEKHSATLTWRKQSGKNRRGGLMKRSSSSSPLAEFF